MACLFLPILAILTILPLSISSQAIDKTVIVGSTVNIDCQSNIAPTWQWFGPKSAKNRILAINGNQHPDFTDDRFTFQKKGSTYSVTIKDIKVPDAGTYACVGDKYTTIIVNILR